MGAPSIGSYRGPCPECGFVGGESTWILDVEPGVMRMPAACQCGHRYEVDVLFDRPVVAR